MRRAGHHVPVRIFRELIQNGDNPHRRNHREAPSPTKDEGDLFIHRPSPRKIRILLDVEHLPEDCSESAQIFNALLKHPRVFSLDVDVSTVTSTSYPTPPERGKISIRDVTADTGAFAYPGRQYGWSIDDTDAHPDGSSTMARRGSSHPDMQIYETAQAYRQLDPQQRAGFQEDDAVAQAIVAEVARDAGFDLLISESPASVCRYLPVHDRAVVLSRTEAVPVIAHYLRRQHIFLAQPFVNGYYHSRHDFYGQSVHALAPSMRGWEDRFGLPFFGGATAVQSRYVTAVSRLSRALESRDDIIWSLGCQLTQAVRDDCLDDFDHLLLMLCGGIDVLARALHLALGLPPENVRYAKLHSSASDSWYATNVVERYRDSPAEKTALAELGRLHKDVRVVFELRNSIHNVQIQSTYLPLAAPGSPILRSESSFPVHVTDDIVSKIKEINPSLMAEWGLRELASQGAVADIWNLTEKAVAVTFQFLNLLSLIVLRNQLPTTSTTLPAVSSITPSPLAGFDDHLPALLGLSMSPRSTLGETSVSGAMPEHGAGSNSKLPTVQETWWSAHVRACIVKLRAAADAPSPNDQETGSVEEQRIRDALESGRDVGCEWPEPMKVAQAILTDPAVSS